MDDRSLTLTRLIKASPQKVWRCWTDPAILPQWFGPIGHSCTTERIDLRQGGEWVFTMHGPKGEIWPNRHRYQLMKAPGADGVGRIEFLMDAGEGSDPHADVVVDIHPEAGGTRITQLMTFPTPEICAAVKDFGAVELGQTTLAKLAAIAEAD